MVDWILDLWRGNTLGGRKRSPQWRITRREYAKLYPKICPFCLTKKRIELHHKKKFSDFPELENVFDNLMWACRHCHYIFCHWKSWYSINTEVEETLEWYRNKIKNRP